MPNKKQPKKNGKNRSVASGAMEYNSPNHRVQVAAGVTAIIRQPGMLVPDRLVNTLVYLDSQSQSRNNATAGYLSWRYRANSAYDPDPAVGSGGTSGFSELAAFYGNYRVLALEYEANVLNLDTKPGTFVAIPTTTDLGTNYSTIVNTSEYARGKSTNVSGAGGMDRNQLRGRFSIHELVGTESALFGEDYMALSTGNPTKLVYINFGWNYMVGTMTNGIATRVILRYTVEWTNRVSLSS